MSKELLHLTVNHEGLLSLWDSADEASRGKLDGEVYFDLQLTPEQMRVIEDKRQRAKAPKEVFLDETPVAAQMREVLQELIKRGCPQYYVEETGPHHRCAFCHQFPSKETHKPDCLWLKIEGLGLQP